MSRPYLFGPVSLYFAEQYLHTERKTGCCSVFGPDNGLDLDIGPEADWQTVCAKFPPDKRPEFIVLYMQYRAIPPWLWTVPVPIITLAGDWNLQWHSYQQLRCSDLVLTDALGAEMMRRAGINQVRPAILFGGERDFLEATWPEQPRDIDVLFVGNFNTPVQRERLALLGRIAPLGQKRKVLFATNIYGEDYRKLLARTRIVFNRGIRSEWNLRVTEALAAGALLFQEEDNREVSAHLRDRQECVYYNADTLVPLLQYYLDHEDERRGIAEAGRLRLKDFSFGQFWQQQLNEIDAEWVSLLERSRNRHNPSSQERLRMRTWQAYPATGRNDPTLIQDLQQYDESHRECSTIQNALGYAMAMLDPQGSAGAAANALPHFQRAWDSDHNNVVAGLNVAEAYAELGQIAQAVEQARQVLTAVNASTELDASALDCPHFPADFDYFRVEWERAAWQNAGDPKQTANAKRNLLLWRLHLLLADLTDDVHHYEQAAQVRPDLPNTQGSLGCGYARKGRFADAVAPLERALTLNPFDRQAARALYQVLKELGRDSERDELARNRRLLHQIAPQVVPEEPWFYEESKPPQPVAVVQSERFEKLTIAWDGDQKNVHSLSLVNQAFCEGLIRRGHSIVLGEGTDVDVCVRQAWPPRLSPPESGHWVMMQPWEFGSLPKDWVEIMSTQVDELWANSRYVQDVYLQSGVPADRVHLVPLGVDVGRFHPEAPRYALQTKKRFKFLFVGGTIYRKGIDVLLDAYTQAFRSCDEVCLVIKDMGVGTFYQGQTAEARIAELQKDPEAPDIEYIDRTLSSEELAGLYTACDCLAHPYRGEGFGLPIAEAMASGLCVIVTGMGAALDFCNDSNAYLIPAQRRYFGKNVIGDMETVDTPWLAEPAVDALRQTMQFVAAHPEEARAKGLAASEHVRRHFTWEQAVERAETRLRELRKKSICRFAPIKKPMAIQQAVAPHVTLCMIVKDEEQMLPDCLRSVEGIFGQTVIVDTGSADRTKEIARSFGAEVRDYAWIDSFAAARNESLKHATGKWILWLDADERLDATNRERLIALLASLGDENVGYIMRQSSRLEHGPNAQTHVDQVRLFPNHPGLRWQYRVHEQILPGLRSVGVEVRPTDIVIEHVGFEDPALQGPKVERNLRLLKLEIEDNPDDTFVLYNLGAVAITQNRNEEAIDYLERCLNLSRPDDHLLAKVHSLVSRAYQQLGKLADALVACRHGRKAFPQDAELLFLEAVLLHQRKDLPGAERCLLQILDLPKNVSFAGADSGLMTYRPRLFLNEIYRELDRLDDAATMLRAVVTECPFLGTAWRQLAEICFEQARWPEMAEAIEHIRNDPQESLQAAFIMAQAHLAQKEFGQAQTLLESIIATAPQAVAPKVYLSRVYLQEGKDWSTAERLLREVLSLDPENREALHNLQALLQQRSNPSTTSVCEVKKTAPTLKKDDTARAHAFSTKPSRKPRAGQRMSISLCMIVKDEEENLPACIESVRDLVDELIIVDTGSKDRTKEIALAYGAKVFNFPWIDNFAAARNESLKHATCEWIFWMDADDRLDEANRAKLRELFASLEDENVGYVMKCLCLPDPETKTATEVDHLRLFRNRADIRWKYRVHEQILPAIRASGGEVRWSDVVVHHVGYQDSAVRQRKLQRDLRILLLDHAENPDDPFILFNLGAVYQEQNRQREAIPLFWRSLELSNPTDSIVRKLYVLIAQCHNQLGEFQKSMTAIKQGQGVYPDDVELLFQEGVTLRHLGDAYGAIRAWEQVLKIPPGAHFASLNPGIRSYLTRQNLAIAYQDIKRFDQAEAQWRRIIDEHPEYEPGWRGLAELALCTQRWQVVEEIAKALEQQTDRSYAAILLRGRVMLARQEFEHARHCFQQVWEELPQALEPRIYLSYAYLQEGKDWVAAEHALRDILALDPNHSEARHNLDVLLSQKRTSN